MPQSANISLLKASIHSSAYRWCTNCTRSRHLHCSKTSTNSPTNWWYTNCARSGRCWCTNASAYSPTTQRCTNLQDQLLLMQRCTEFQGGQINWNTRTVGWLLKNVLSKGRCYWHQQSWFQTSFDNARRKNSHCTPHVKQDVLLWDLLGDSCITASSL